MHTTVPLTPQAMNETGTPMFSDRDDVTGIVAAMRARLAEEGVQEHACRALLGRGIPKAEATAAAAPPAVVAAMQAHPSAPGLQMLACQLLSSWIDYSNANQQAVGDAGGCEAVVGALSNAPQPEHACRCLCRLLTHPGNFRRVVDAGGCEVLVSVMKAHVSDAAVQEPACQAIVLLAEHGGELQRRLGDLAVGETIVQGMRTLSAKAAVQEFACLALSRLVNGHVVNQSRVDAAGVADLCALALATHPLDAGVRLAVHDLQQALPVAPATCCLIV